MPYSFTVAQSPLDPSLVVVTDTSTSIDPSITQRRIYVQDAAGNYLVPSGTLTDYTPWPLADASIDLDILSQDTAVAITVQWLNISNVVVEDLTQLYCLAEFNKSFYVSLFQSQSLTPDIVQDNDYFANLSVLWQNIIGAIQAVEIGGDIASSQNCLDRATNMQNNQQFYF